MPARLLFAAVVLLPVYAADGAGKSRRSSSQQQQQQQPPPSAAAASGDQPPPLMTITPSAPALVHLVTEPGAQAKFPAICTYVGDFLVTAFSDQSDAFHEAGDTGQSYASRDGGQSWAAVPNTLAPWIMNSIMPKNGSSVLAFTYMLKGKPLVDAAHAYLQAYTLQPSSSSLAQSSTFNITFTFPPGHTVDPYGVGGKPSADAFAMVATGLTLPLKTGGVLATLYGTYKNDGQMSERHYSLVAMISFDGGHHWNWRSTVASHRTKGTPGACAMPSESSTVYLKNGSLFTVFRSDGGPLCSCFSSDDALSWSVPAVMAGIAHGVEPKLRVLKSGHLALSTGRPGIYLYTSTDPPTQWQQFNIAAAHNKLVKQTELRFNGDVPGGGTNGTTSYTGMAIAKDTVAGSDAVFVSYDRLGNGWGTVSKGQASAVFVMKLSIKVNKLGSSSVPVKTDDASTTLFRANTDGYHTFRIPGLLSNRRGTVLALAEGRSRIDGPGTVCEGWSNNSCCYGSLASHYDGKCRDKDVVLKASTDFGKSFGAVQTLASANATHFYSNLMGVLDGSDGLVLMYSRCLVNVPGGKSYDTCVPVLAISSDLGRSFSHRVDLPASLARGIGGPTVGLRIATGRLLFPFQCAPKFSSCVLYTDNKDITDPSAWRRSEPDFASTAPDYGMENSLSKLSADGTNLLMVSRNHNLTAIVSSSSDGGSSFFSHGLNSNFFTSGCETSSLGLPTHQRVLFAHPNVPGMPASSGPNNRQNMTVTSIPIRGHASLGARARDLLQVYSGPAGYSSLGEFSDGRCGVLYEASPAGDVPIDFDSIELASFACNGSSTVIAPTASAASAPTLKLPTVLASNMVIQRANKPGRQSSLWGWANSSSSVTVTLDGKLLGQAVPNASDGRWTFALPVDAHKEASAGPHTIEVSAGAGATETLTNVAIGDVFFCSGQSNMEYSVNKAFNASAEIADSVHYPDLRFVTFAENAAHAPVTIEPWSIPVSKAPYVWGVSKPANFMPPTGKIQSYPCAVCYFFGRDLYKALGGKVPIGLVQATRGGTKVESFMSPEAIADKTCGGSMPEPGIEPEIGSGSDLWYGMILPLTPLKLSGQLWYQGEANDLGKHPPFVGPKNYQCHFPSMISSWRSAWEQPELPFFYVLLAAGHTALLRESQVAGASLLKHTAWATAADLGDGVAGGPDGPCPVPGHPRRKQEVGRRLSLAALNLSYGMDVSWMGPVIETASAVRRPSALVDGSEIEVTLTMSEPVHEHGQADCVACCESGVATSPIMLSAPTTAAAADVSGRSSNCDELNKVCPRMEGLQAACLACANAHAKELAKDAGCTSGLISDWCNKSHAPRSSKCSTELNNDCPGLKGKNATCFACTAAHEGALTKADCPQSLLKDWCAAPPKSTSGVRTVVIVDGATVTAHATLTAEQLPPNATHVELLFEFENFGQCALYGGGPTDGPEPHGVYSGTGIVSRERRLLLPLKTVVMQKTNVSDGDAQD